MMYSLLQSRLMWTACQTPTRQSLTMLASMHHSLSGRQSAHKLRATSAALAPCCGCHQLQLRCTAAAILVVKHIICCSISIPLLAALPFLLVSMWCWQPEPHCWLVLLLLQGCWLSGCSSSMPCKQQKHL